MLSIKDHVKGKSNFKYYRAGNLYYETDTGVEFFVPITDTNDATFPNEEKSIFFMRWIRKRLELGVDTVADNTYHAAYIENDK